MDKIYSGLNLLSVLIAIGVNAASQSRLWDLPTVGEISGRYPTLITPAGYAFSIWGAIFLGLLAIGAYGVYRAFRYSDNNGWIARTVPWFCGANLFNALWVWVFSHEMLGLSVAVIFALLACLIALIRVLDMERWDAPIGTIAFLWWPICLYSGWISIAVIANVAVWLSASGWSGWGDVGPADWTLAMIGVAIALNWFMVFSRNMREFALVGAWALAAIAMRHLNSPAPLFYVPMVGTILLVGLAVWHGWRNRATNPLVKLRQRFGR